MRKGILLSMLGFGLAAFLMGSATMAWFTDDAQVDTTFASGTILIGAAGSTGWAATYPNLAPGQNFTANLTVKNTGTLTMKYRMYATLGNTPPELAGKLMVTVKDGNTILKGPLALNAFTESNSLFLGNMDAGDPDPQRTLTVYVELPWDADNTVKGQTVNATFRFEATQPENAGWTQTGNPPPTPTP